MKRQSRRLSRRLSRRSGKGKAPPVVNPRGVSLRSLEELRDDVLAGQDGVHLFVLIEDAGDGVPEGTTVKLAADSSPPTFALPFARAGDLPTIITCGSHQVREKARAEWSTEDVLQHVVLPRTAERECSYLDILPKSDVGEEHVGTCMIHAHQSSFVELVAALTAHFKKVEEDAGGTFVWLDVVCANQHVLQTDESATSSFLEAALPALLQAFPSALLFFDAWDDPTPFRRSWCVFEVLARGDRPLAAIFAPGQDERFLDALLDDPKRPLQTVADLDARSTACASLAQKEAIDEAVEAELPEGITTLSGALLQLLRDWMLAVARSAVVSARASAGASERVSAGGSADERQLSLASTLHAVGEYLFTHGLPAEAAPLHREGLELRLEAEHNPNGSLLVARSLQLVAVAELRLGLYDEVEGRLGEAMDIITRAEPEAPAHLRADVLLRMGIAKERRRFFGEAATLIAQALELVGDDDARRADALVAKAAVHWWQGEYEQARASDDEALEIRTRVLGPRHPKTATSLNGLGCVMDDLRDGANARKCYRESLSIRVEKLGLVHPDVANSMNNVAVKLKEDGDLQGALVIHRDALKIRENALSMVHLEVANSLYNIASILVEQGKLGSATRLYERCARIRERALGDASNGAVAAATMALRLERLMRISSLEI